MSRPRPAIQDFPSASAMSADGLTVVEVEAGTGVANNGYLKDLFQACLLPDVQYLVVAMRQVYQGVCT